MEKTARSFSLDNFFNITIRCHQGFVYIILENKNKFFEDLRAFLQHFSQILNQNFNALFKLSILSSNLSSFFLGNKSQDVEINSSLDVDEQTLTKIHHFFNKKSIPFENEQVKLLNNFFLLLKQTIAHHSLANTEQVLEASGMNMFLSDPQRIFGIFKNP